MIASSFGDPVLGIDVHFEMVPTPAPVPTPIPNPFTGVVFDPIGLAVGIALGAAIGAVMGAPFQGPVLYWTAFPATNTGTEAKHVPGHILIPPGTAWAPFPKTPKPVIRPGETPSPPKPVMPENDAVMIFGSKTVSVMGSNAVRLGDIALSCSEPLRLPSSVVLAVPKGAPILIGGPPSLDLMAAFMASLRTRFMSDSLHALISRLSPSRFRNALHRIACFLTGHPVDVASGRVLTEAVDARLPGPLPLVIERVYSSAFAARSGPIGHGWSFSLDQAVWCERGCVVLLTEDGRELEFDTFDLPEHRIRVGQSVAHGWERLDLHADRDGRFRIVDHRGTTREFAPVVGRSDGRAMIQRIRSRSGHHEIQFVYDERGRLVHVRDCGGRSVRLVWNPQGRLAELYLPAADGHVCHRRYVYDASGDLVEVVDARNHRYRYEYVRHLLTRETDRAGLSFYFMYDGLGEDAWCVRTWGDGGIFDHVIGYDKAKHITFVTDSRGFTTQYHMNLAGQVVKVVNPLGKERCFEYDPKSLRQTAYVDPLGRKTTRSYDGGGNLVALDHPDGRRVEIRYDSGNLPIYARDVRGGEWRCAYDGSGQMTALVGPTGLVTTLTWALGQVVEVAYSDGTRIAIAYDRAKNLTRYRDAAGADLQYGFDARGRVVRTTDAHGKTVRLGWDPEDNPVVVELPLGLRQEAAHDGEGHLVEWRDATRRIQYRYGHMHRLEAEIQDGAAIRYEYDTEDRMIAVYDESGAVHRFERDETGRPRAEIGFDGSRRSYERDAAGRIVQILHASQRKVKLSYDEGDRVQRVEHSDGVTTEFAYDDHGQLVAARTPDAEVLYERDALGRVLVEQMAGVRIESQYTPRGRRAWWGSDLGTQVSIDWSPTGDVARVSLTGAAVPDDAIVFEREAAGFERTRHMPGQVVLQWHRDDLGRPLVRRTMQHGIAGWQQLEARRYTWQGADRLAAIEDAAIGVVEYIHDGRERLVAERHAAVTTGRWMDHTGNVHRRTDGSDRGYAPGGRLEAIEGARWLYDADGFLVTREEPDGRAWQYSWAGGMLRRVECPDGRVATFEYDAFARRTRKVVARVDERGQAAIEDDTRFVWDGHHPIHEISTSRGTTTWHWEPGTFNLLAKEHDGRRYTIVCDQVDVPTEMYDDRGQLVWRMKLDVHGTPTFERGLPTDCPWRWAGGYDDPETELVYLRHRYLARAGVFISPDPLGMLGGLREYGWVDDPLVMFDPLGLHTVYAKLNGQPVRNPRMGDAPLWPNIHGSGSNGMAPSGTGRLGDSENLLLDHLERNNPGGLADGFLEIESLQRGRQGALMPCDFCGDGLQRIADTHGTTIVYRQTKGKGGTRTVIQEIIFRPNQEPEVRPGCGH